MAEEPSPELLRELKSIRVALQLLLGVAALMVGLRIPETVIRPPAPGSEQLWGIQTELRQLREEMASHHAATRPPPVMIPVKPPAPTGDK